jgi:hypothetical protein
LGFRCASVAPTTAEQSKAFIEKAREIGAADAVEEDDEVMCRLAKQKCRKAATSVRE